MQRGAASWLHLTQHQLLPRSGAAQTSESGHSWQYLAQTGDEALQSSSHHRLLRDVAETRPIVRVASVQEFIQAVDTDANDIEITAHLDFRDSQSFQLDAASADKTIRGNCTAAVNFEVPLQGDDLAQPAPGQCVIATGSEGFVTISGGGLWLDSVLVRQGRPALASEAPALVTVESSGQLWLTNVAMRGTGSSTCTAVSAQGRMLSQESTFANLGGNASAVVVAGTTASFLDSVLQDSTVAAQHALITAQGPDAAVWLQGTATARTTGQAFRSEGGAEFLSDDAAAFGDSAVLDADTQERSGPAVVAEQPADITFAMPAEVAQLRADLMLVSEAPVEAAAPPDDGRGGVNLAAIIGAAVAALVVLVVAVLLTTRRRRGHTFQRDAWGLPINPVGPARERALSHQDSLPARAHSGLSPSGRAISAGSKPGSSSVPSVCAVSAPSDALTLSASAREGMITTETGSTGPVALGAAEPQRSSSQGYVTGADGTLYAVAPYSGELLHAGNYHGNPGAAAGGSYAGPSISLASGAHPSGHMSPVPVFVHHGLPSAADGGAPSPALNRLPSGARPLQGGPSGGSLELGMAMGSVATVASYVPGGAAGWHTSTPPHVQAGQAWAGPTVSQPLGSDTISTAAAMPPGSTASLGGGRWGGGQGVTDPTRTLEPTTMGTTGMLLHPGGAATVEELMNFVEMQLDSIGEQPVLSGFVMLGPQERRRGGQAVIQFARRQRFREEVAFKFFVARPDYDSEVQLYQNDVLGDFLPMAEAYVDNTDGAFRDAFGNAFPPCIVMERGETLHDRIRIALTDKAGTAQVLVNIAKRLSSLHAAGWVHRDLKPGNVLWLSRKQRWTLIDFGLAARTGADVSASFTPMYAAPEVVHAYKLGNGRTTAQPSQDAWALGVMAFELLIGKPAFDKFEGHASVYSQLLGEAELPWEGERLTEEVKRMLGVFWRPVLSLLDREPGARISLQEFANSCDSIFDSPSLPNPAAAEALS